jgi:hypothetical protein
LVFDREDDAEGNGSWRSSGDRQAEVRKGWGEGLSACQFRTVRGEGVEGFGGAMWPERETDGR